MSKNDPTKGRNWNHTRLVLEKAHVESRGEWPFDVDLAEPAIIKTAPTPKDDKQFMEAKTSDRNH